MKKHPRRVYVFRRVLVTIMAAFFAVVGYGMYEEFTSPSYECEQQPVVVHSGDTLWTIAEKRCTGDLLEVRYELVKSYGTVIQPGQIVQLPEGDQ